MGFALRVGGNGFYFLEKKKKEQGIVAHDCASPIFFIHPLNAQSSKLSNANKENKIQLDLYFPSI